MSINKDDIKNCVIRPSLKKVGLYSPPAENLLLATMAQETLGGRYLIQHTKRGIFWSGGYGIYQMEEKTYNDLLENFLVQKPDLKENILKACNYREFPSAYDMVADLQLATIMARVLYLRVKAPLPSINDLEGIWGYYKQYWNTYLGKATRTSFIKNYENYVGYYEEKS